MNTDQRINIKKFIDYRAFMHAHYRGAKKKNPYFSLGSLAQALQLSSTSSISKIISGERHPGPQIIDRLVSYYRFEKRDAEYFKKLVRLQKLPLQHPARLEILNALGLVKESPELKTIDLKTFEIVSSTLCFVIREMMKLPDFKPDPDWILRRLHFKSNKREVERSIGHLLRAGVAVQEDQTLRPASTRIQTTHDVPSEAIKLFHESSLELAAQALRSVPVQGREFSASTIRIRHDRIDEAKQLLREFRKKFVNLLEDEQGDDVYFFQFQLYPATKKTSGPVGDKITNAGADLNLTTNKEEFA